MTEKRRLKAGDRVKDKGNLGIGTILGPDAEYGGEHYEVRFDDFESYDDSEMTDCHTRKESELELVQPAAPQHEGVNWPNHLQEWENMLLAKKAQEEDFYARVEAKTNAIRDLLVEKNKKYGDVALNPIHIFSPWDSANALKVRIDDKLARMKSLGEKDDEDTVKDLIGYLVLYQIAKDKKAEAE